MFLPKYKIQIFSNSFYPDKFICEGKQLAMIVDFLGTKLIPHTWYASDLEPVGRIDLPENNIRQFQLIQIGDDPTLIKICSKVTQFIWGVFLAVDVQYLDQDLEQIEAGTEDDAYRQLAVKGVLVEIRAFDTSFFEIYSEDKNLICEIAKKFNVSIQSIVKET